MTIAPECLLLSQILLALGHFMEIIQILPEFTCLGILTRHFGNPETRKIQMQTRGLNQGPAVDSLLLSLFT